MNISFDVILATSESVDDMLGFHGIIAYFCAINFIYSFCSLNNLDIRDRAGNYHEINVGSKAGEITRYIIFLILGLDVIINLGFWGPYNSIVIRILAGIIETDLLIRIPFRSLRDALEKRRIEDEYALEQLYEEREEEEDFKFNLDAIKKLK